MNCIHFSTRPGTSHPKNSFWLEGKPTFVPVSSKLVLEDASAKTRHVTVSGDNLSVEEAIAKIADASGCNIFRDKDTIVVDYCKPQ